MTVIMCANDDDDHGDFPHRLVIPLITRIVHGQPKTTMGTPFVICAHCDHWVNRSVPKCHCRHRCHERAAQAARDRYRSVTKNQAREGSTT